MLETRALLLLATLCSGTSGAACRTDPGLAATPAPATLSLAEAIGTVSLRGPTGTILRAEFRQSPTHGSVYAVELLFEQGELLTVRVDARDGSLLTIERAEQVGAEARIAAVLLARAPLSFIEAIVKAERDTDGAAIKAELVEDDYQITLLTELGPVTLTIDRNDGRILARQP